MGWTTERKETLKRMWLAGDTSKRISETLGEVSRNAVMGMVNRMGLMGSVEHNSRMGAKTSGACRPKRVTASSRKTASSDVVQDQVGVPIMDGAVVGVPHATAAVTAATTVPVPIDHDVDVPVIAVPFEPTPETPAEKVPAKIEETPPWDASPSEPVFEATSVEPPVHEAVVVQPVVAADDAVTDVTVVPPGEQEVATVDLPVADDVSVITAVEATVDGAKASKADTPREARKAIDLGNAAPPPSRRRKDADRVQRSPESERRRLIGPLSGLRSPMVKTMSTRIKPQPEPVRVATDGSRPVDWRTALTLVEETTGFPYDPSRPGHRAALVAIGTVLARGDPRRVLSPFLSEPQIIAMMRCLAEKGIVVGGKTPQSWLEPDHGDMAFMIDMLVAEGVLDPKVRNREMADAA